MYGDAGIWEWHTCATDEVQEKLMRWNLPDDKLVAVTSDNARNTVNAIYCKVLIGYILVAFPTHYSWVLKG